MKKLIIGIVIILTMAMLTGTAGCSAAGSRAATKEYNVGGAVITDTVENINIDWNSGKVNIVTGSNSGIEFSEKIPEGLPEDEQLHWLLDGTTLYIKANAPHYTKIFDFSCGFEDNEKELTVTVPEMLIFNDVNISVSSAAINAPVIKAVNITASSSSGKMDIGCICTEANLSSSSGKIKANCTADKVSASASSGRLSLALSGKTDVVKLSTSSGDISVNAENIGSFKAETSSGSVDAEISADKIEISTSSGKIDCKELSQPSECKLSSSSGKVTLRLPSDAQFTADIRQSSGEFECDFPVVMKKDKYVCGDGSAIIKVETSSGDCNILTIE